MANGSDRSLIMEDKEKKTIGEVPVSSEFAERFLSREKKEKEEVSVIVSEPLLPPVSAGEQTEMFVKKNRKRNPNFPKRLPTMGLSPMPVDEHPHIGNYESKQNLYLITATSYNTLMDYVERIAKKISSLEDRLDKLEGKKTNLG